MGNVTELLGGGLKPNEPRRFLLEAMIGAAHADGDVDPRELAVLEYRIAQHPLFVGLGPDAARTLLGLATDAIKFSGHAASRAPVIAQGLPARIHRFAAYALATEIAVADQQIHEGEAAFLEALRGALRIGYHEATEIMRAAQGGNIGGYLQGVYQRLLSLVPYACEMFALRALMRNTITDDHRGRLRTFLSALPDLTLPTNDLDGELYRAFHRPRSPTAQTLDELKVVASYVTDYVDRYWLMVYALVAEEPAKLAQWKIRPFTRVLQSAFGIADTDMELAVADARLFPADLQRPEGR